MNRVQSDSFSDRNTSFAPRLFMVGVVALLAGCASVPLPPEAAAIRVVPFSSAAIEVHRPRFLAGQGDLELEVYVLRQRKAETTADSHLDLIFTDAQGRALKVDTSNFNPRSLPKTSRLPGPHAYVRVRIPEIPSGATALEVRGHDGPHESRTVPSTLSTPN